MTDFVDLELESAGADQSRRYDVVIIGGGAAGLTLVRELAGKGLTIAVLESGGLEESADHESLNAVEVSGVLLDDDLQQARQDFHGPQMRYWNRDVQRFGVRCRVLGGSTAAWAGKLAPFDAIDYEARPWIPAETWPIEGTALTPYLDRAARYLDLGPLIQGKAFWAVSGRDEPPEFARLENFGAFFWQFARSRQALTDVMRFGPDFRRETYKGVTIFLNATAAAVKTEGDAVSGVDVRSSLTGRSAFVGAAQVVLAAGAIENARLLLLSIEGFPPGPKISRDAVGRYLMDHPSVSLGSFNKKDREKAAGLLGFYPILQGYRVYMYACGLALDQATQRRIEAVNMAAFTKLTLAPDDPLLAFSRLLGLESRHPLSDAICVVRNFGVVVTAIGRKLLNYRRIPERVRRLMADALVFLGANMVAREYVGGNRGRRLDHVALNIISEQPAQPENRIALSERTDRLGLRMAHVQWNLPASLRADMLRFAQLLKEDLDRAGIRGFRLDPAFATGDMAGLVIHDMAHTAGTTRMGLDPASSVVDPSLQVHGVRGLFVAGASVFPSSGHANPTLVILALAIRLADHIKEQAMTRRVEMLSESLSGPLSTSVPPVNSANVSEPVPRSASGADALADAKRPLVLVTGATGKIGNAVISELCARGYRVRGQYRSTVPSVPGVVWVRFDFSEAAVSDAALDALVQGADAVIHLAASLSNLSEMEMTNVVNLGRLAAACGRAGVRYFGQASSVVVYGSPKTGRVTEDTPRIDLNQRLEKQYFAEPYMREYARSKIRGEDLLHDFGHAMHVDIYRIAVAQGPEYLADSLNWSTKRAFFSLYRNSHYISLRNVARAIVHLIEYALKDAPTGVEVYNISDPNAPTFSDVYRCAGRKPPLHLPIVLDLLKGVAIGKTLSRRRPFGSFRLDGGKLASTGFVLERDA